MAEPNVPLNIAPEDWREYARSLAGRAFDLGIAVVALRRQLAELQASVEEALSENEDSE